MGSERPARLAGVAALLGLIALCVSACGSDTRSSSSGMAAVGAVASDLPTGGEPVQLDPAEFGANIDNPYWPMAPGSRWRYRERDAAGNTRHIEVTVLGKTERIAGIDARVVHDVVSENGEVQENTYDWYAQDSEGNIWYLGEDTTEYEHGRVKTRKGSWRAGIDGAQAGVILPAHPRLGVGYRQEYYEGKAEDAAEVLGLGQRARVPYGFFDRLLVTRDYTPLEPDVVEHKFYALGLGPILAVTVAGGRDHEALVRFQRGGSS
jgi:hypothetical protein